MGLSSAARRKSRLPRPAVSLPFRADPALRPDPPSPGWTLLRPVVRFHPPATRPVPASKGLWKAATTRLKAAGGCLPASSCCGGGFAANPGVATARTAMGPKAAPATPHASRSGERRALWRWPGGDERCVVNTGDASWTRATRRGHRQCFVDTGNTSWAPAMLRGHQRCFRSAASETARL